MTTTFGACSSGPSYGSCTKTSIAAPATLPDSSAATSASSSTSSPRAALTIRTPSRIFAIASASIAPRVSSVSGRCSVRKSARASTSSNAQRSRRRARGTARPRRTGRTRRPSSAARARAARPAGRSGRTRARRAPCRRARRRPTSSAPSGPRRARRAPAGCCARARRSSPIVCSAAETTFDSGAFATTIPRRVAASTSTLSTPTPARPITFSRVAARDHLGGHLRRRADDQRVVVADDLLERRVRCRRRRRTARAAARRRRPRSARGRGLCSHAATGASNASNARATATPRSMSAPSSVSDSSTAASARRDVEDVEPADVADPEDLPLQVRLARCERDAVPVAEMQQQLVAVDAVRRADGGHDGGRVVVGREELEPHRLHARARRAAEPDVPLERRLEPVVEDQPERDVEAADQRDRRRERRVELVLRRLVRRASRSRSCATASRAASTCSGTEAIASPGGHISAFCEPEIDDVDPPGVGLERHRAERRDRVDDEHRVADRLLDRPHVGDDAGRGVGLLAEDDLDAGLAHRRADLARIRRLAPLVADRVHVEPVLLADRDPALAERPVADDRDAVARARRGSRPPTPSRRSRTP